jgi:hypothetical protein
LAFVSNTHGIPVAAGALFPLFGILLNPMIAGAALVLSSVTVASTANRPLRGLPCRPVRFRYSGRSGKTNNNREEG